MIRTGDILSIGLVLQSLFIIKLIYSINLSLLWQTIGMISVVLIFISELVYAWQKFGGRK